ncbi:MAG: NADH-quinone oxidoreductase subunit NuoF [Candidatus Omnitrophica bacterium]|nr:NADH-quinone oxidoreductase subunit NuoF [Candidatus Omnitrophota bacterium]MBU1127779.1 NADH-quinone oxidoreductase subunit NuoF [Candidatus Omnitrophota bacterium]MBU1784640.1 NADH-quinone oxidoreductase subunit NuoF [Candidatus Omnitrophota bacterium]MBU1852252.1 NADH-quinone oxidoreductase subunit NuoF [Candidatus Omnitrophota bacterium]
MAKNEITVLICQGTACVSGKAPQIREALESEVKKAKLGRSVKVDFTGCHGFCQRGPIIIIEPEGIFYCDVKLEDVHEVVQSHLKENTIVERLLYKDPATGKAVPHYRDITFYKDQQRIVLANCGHINPEEISEYLDAGGYQALKKAMSEMGAEKVINEIKKSGLRGRGGAGFSTGVKWGLCRAAKGKVKYVICNADEGDPGAFMDRSILEGDPHAVIEGIIIAGYAIGAGEAYVYCRAEYPLALKRLKKAIAQAEEKGFLGRNILGTEFSFAIKVKEGAGAFVCGEETALIASVEGRRGMPRPRPPFPANEGLWGKPTLINNVETFANISHILVEGAEWFSSIGTGTSKGTKVFALAGKVKNTGLIEVPMGTTIRELVFGPGGGMLDAKAGFKGVQIGGPSGGCLPESLLDTPIDYESITKTGAIMGSGGMVVLDEKACMVDIAKFFLKFTVAESCGKCVPCRVGLKRMLEVTEEISSGNGKEEHLQFLQEMGENIRKTALCGLGNTAPNPVLTTLKYFADEYKAHIEDKTCPAHVCTGLIKFEVIEEKCVKCGLCYKACPAGAIEWEPKGKAKIDKEKCIKCKACIEACRFKAIR